MKLLFLSLIILLSLNCFAQVDSAKLPSDKKVIRSANSERIIGSILILGGSASVGAACVIYMLNIVVTGTIDAATSGYGDEVDHSTEKYYYFQDLNVLHQEFFY